jgi:hypothetical protein
MIVAKCKKSRTPTAEQTREKARLRRRSRKGCVAKRRRKEKRGEGHAWREI